MAASREDREQIRCSNSECPSRRGGGQARIVVERGIRTGWYYKRLGKDGEGRELEMISAFPVKIPCGSCGQNWLNPGLPIIDGMHEVMREIKDEVIERLAQAPDRGSLRRGDRAACGEERAA